MSLFCEVQMCPPPRDLTQEAMDLPLQGRRGWRPRAVSTLQSTLAWAGDRCVTPAAVKAWPITSGVGRLLLCLLDFVIHFCE